MRRRIGTIVAIGAVGFSLALPTWGGDATAQDATPSGNLAVEVALNDVDGNVVGAATLTELSEGVQVAVSVESLPPGDHGIHLHEVGICDPAGEMPFASAGAHFNPIDAPHGAPPDPAELASPAADHRDHVAHAGDLGNITVADDGTGTLDVFSNRFTLSPGPTSLGGEYGASLVIHANADDLTTQPTGDSGGRIACGVVVASAAGTPVPAEATPAASPVAAADVPAAASILVDMIDIAFVEPEIRIPANTDVTFTVQNSGAAVHDFAVEALGVDSGDVAPGAATEVVVNAAPGEYPFVCTIPGHAAVGMVGTLIVA